MRSRRPEPTGGNDETAASQTQRNVLESFQTATMDDYVAHARPVPHLFDLAPQRQPGFRGAQSDVSELAAAVRHGGERETDVRLLIDHGARLRGLAEALAANLSSDVYFAPSGARIRYARESSAFAGDAWDAIAVDGSTAEPVDWCVARPPGLSPRLPTWFVSSRGRLRQRSGLVTLPLPDGRAFATKATFRDMAELTARIRTGPSLVTTLTVDAEQGRFEISRFDDGAALLGGVEFATLVAASLDVIHPDVQVALTWPTSAELCATLDGELMRLADGLDRTVWVPEPAGAAVVLPGVGEFAAVDEVGAAGAWRAYPSRRGSNWRCRHRSDSDGRLVPIGDVAVKTFPGARFVSVPGAQLERLREWYESWLPAPDSSPSTWPCSVTAASARVSRMVER